MGFGLKEDWEEERCRELSVEEKLVSAHFELDHDEWSMVPFKEKQRLIGLYKLTSK